MTTARSAWGIDIGNRALKAVKLTREGEEWKIDDFEVIEHEHILSHTGDNKDALIQSSLANFVQRHPIKGEPVCVSVSGQSSFARFLKLPPVEPRKIPEIVRFEAIQQIPFPLEEVEWSYQLFQTPDSPDVEVGIFAMKKELVNRHIQFFTEINLNVRVVQMGPLAVYNALRHDQRFQGTTMVIDMGAENCDLIIADGETIWLRSIPVGGNNFTEALVKSFKLSFDKAEDLKRGAKTSRYARQIFQAMRPVFADLVAEVQRSIGFYASVHRDSRIKTILALGSTFELQGLRKYLQQNLQLDVIRLDGLSAKPPEDGKLAAAFSQNLLSLVTAYGLALQGLGEGKIVSSLLPMQIRREKLWSEKTKWFALAASVFSLGTAVPFGAWYYQDLQYSKAQEVRDHIETVRKNAETLSNTWQQQIEAAGNIDRQRIQNIRDLEQYRSVQAHLVTDIYDALPKPPELDDLAAGNLDKIKSVPRNQRQEVFIDNITSQYVPNLEPILASPNFSQFLSLVTSAAVQPETTGNVMPNTRHGFLVAIRGTTPYKDGYQLVSDQLVKSLLGNLGPSGFAQRGYYVARATIHSARPLEDDVTRLSKMMTAFTELSRDESGSTVAGAAKGPYKDRITDEDMRKDWEYIVLMAIVLDPPKH